ncbi:MAG: dihydroorotate dehydrogenase-like protein [Acidimicrobiia bacterium]|nr:dihydroorotate dehydrogenase-like protein [Acidimicrobiia bacterium]
MTVDMTTRYLGLTLANPVVASSSPMTGDMDRLLQLQEAGIAAVVLPSLFEEQVEHEAMAMHNSLEVGAGAFAEATDGYLPEVQGYTPTVRDHIQLVERAHAELSVPVIASLNGVSTGGWTLYARILEEAGADAIELNVYLVTADPTMSGQQIERQYLDLVSSIRGSVDIPVAVKIGPFFSSMAHMAGQLVDAGADALVLFNRFYQPDIDIHTLSVTPSLELSAHQELRPVLRWISILRSQLECGLAGTTGVHSAPEVVKLLLAGADVTMMASALLRGGPDQVRTVLDHLAKWLLEHEYESVDQARGSVSQQNVDDPSVFERANYMKTLVSYSAEWSSRH